MTYSKSVRTTSLRFPSALVGGLLAVIAAISVSCSNGPAGADSDNGGSGNTTASSPQQTVKFSECMRSNGVAGFPDPDASGNLTIDQIANGSSLDTSSTAFSRAMTACKDLEPPGFTGSKRSPAQQQSALKFAQCVRDNGVKDFPDPTEDSPLVDTNRIPSTARSGGMSALQAAMQKCSGFATDAGVSGAR